MRERTPGNCARPDAVDLDADIIKRGPVGCGHNAGNPAVEVAVQILCVGSQVVFAELGDADRRGCDEKSQEKRKGPVVHSDVFRYFLKNAGSVLPDVRGNRSHSAWTG